MTIPLRLERETIFLTIIAGVFSGYLVWRNTQTYSTYLTIPFIASNTTQNVIMPVIDPVLKIDTASQISPDGTKKLSMKTTHNTDGTSTYEIATSDGSGANKQQLYTTKLAGSENMSIPFNAWSPDNKYLFVKKNGNNALVFTATGESITKDQVYLDVLDSFTKRGNKDTVKEVTGWASPTLLIFNTAKQDDTFGSSYWFEIPSKAIIQLSSQF